MSEPKYDFFAPSSIIYPSLESLAEKHGTTKLAHPSYMRAYEQMLHRSIKTVLEMGIGDGSSLRMWRDYFPNSQITGLDTNPDCKSYEEERIKVIIGDQSDDEVLKSFGKFDLIIDDAGHDCNKQQKALSYLFNNLNTGGCYVIEDLESSYWKHYRGPNSTVEFLKKCLEGINFKYTHEAKLPGLVESHWYTNICFLFKE